tara:strand:- start:314 stop:766 length:453 start_codon:yes stop_codon:yes gene_type:complete
MSGLIGSAGSKSGLLGETELDYETGSWTPNTNSQGNLTFSIQSAQYTKVGRLVTVQAYLEGNNNGSSNVDYKIYGLPFTALANASPQGETFFVGSVNTSSSNSGTGDNDMVCRVAGGSTNLYFCENPQVSIKQDAIDHAHTIFSITYFSD